MSGFFEVGGRAGAGSIGYHVSGGFACFSEERRHVVLWLIE